MVYKQDDIFELIKEGDYVLILPEYKLVETIRFDRQ